MFNKEEGNINGNITIYDLAMDRVAKIEGSGVTRWNGNNDFGDRVSSGVYFAKYNHNSGSSHVFNIMVIN